MTAFTVWLTGLSGSGKSTLAGLLAAELRRRGLPVEVIDGDELRQHASKGLGFSRPDREANIRNAAALTTEAVRRGSRVIVALMSPYRAGRQEIRRSLGNFCEVYCECALEVLEQRDPKGLYRRARNGELSHVVGLDEPYEAPEAAEVHLHTDQETAAQSMQRITSKLEELGYLA